MKPILALDLDELLFPFAENFLKYVNNERGTGFSIDDIPGYLFKGLPDIPLPEVLQLIGAFLTRTGLQPLPLQGAVEAVEQLKHQFELVVVTARYDELKEATLAWLQTYFPDMFERIVLCNSFAVTRPNTRTKVDVCLELGAVALVDDSVAHVTEMATDGKRGVLFGDYPWNQTDELPEGVTRARNWDEVLGQLLVRAT